MAERNKPIRSITIPNKQGKQNGQSRDTCNIGTNTLRQQTKTQHKGTKTMSNTDLIKKTGMNAGARDG